ncbi:disco-interacting protein 2 homolog A isoform X2 [Ochotona princeps]|uniref:disco-interacting protein 2 homolog A isoform X2 n=1 Tax=Ochotona princeps TaxID=9978 RepID=UPI002714C0D6|nr:disco-interacting protein 2 homolog A isoform X2 [Ochotona princeps]
MAEHGCPLEEAPLPAEVRESLAELELELSEGDITQKGYEKKRAKLLARYMPLVAGADLPPSMGNRLPGPSQTTAMLKPKSRPATSRDERFRSDVHTEAVQAALARYKEKKMPMPSKRRSVLAHTSAGASTPPDTSSASEDEGSLRPPGQRACTPLQSRPSVEPWLDRVIQGSSTSSSASSTSSHPGARPAAAPSHAATPGAAAVTALAGLVAHTHIDLQSAPPDVTTGLLGHLHCERPQVASVRGVPRGPSTRVLETADGVPVNSRVSSKIQQLLNTLKRPKRPPLKEFFVDDFEELLEVQQPDPSQPKPEGSQTVVLKGEPLSAGTPWPPSLLAALRHWGVTQPKAPCLTALDTAGKAVCTLTYGKLWSRSLKLAYTLLNKLTSRNEPLLKPGDRVALVFPNSDPVMFMVAFYGCLLAELVPVPIEVPLTRKDAGSQQVGFLLGSCGVTLALTTDACQKGLPKAQTGEVVAFKGWPPLSWLVIDGKHLTKPPKDWHPAALDAGVGTAYIEYKTSKDGSTVGITVSHASLLAQCRALTQACGYSEAETVTNVLDFKRDAGLWHGVLTSVMNRLHVVSIPYALMKVNPLSWIQKVCFYKAQAALVKSRDMHWSLLAQRGQRDVSLSSLRMLLVADGANPWSISSCDAFLNVFQSRGLRPEVICPCASSPEALTVALRRPPDLGGPPAQKAVLSMSGLSYGVIRVDTEEKLSVLTVQDVGQVMPGASMCVVKLEGTPYLCKADEVGEICVDSRATATAYYGLLGITRNVFETMPVTAAGVPVSDRPFTRTGLLGFIGPDSLVFVVGKLDGLMVVGVRRHNADDVVATALAVEPMKFVYRGRIAVFSVTVLHDDRIVLVAEQRPDASEEDSFQWMSRVLQAIDSIHQVGVYCLALVPANTLPKAPLGGIHISETRQRFLEGTLHPCNVLMCPHTCVTNLPRPRQKQPEVGPASMVVGNLVSGKRIAQASGRELAHMEDSDQARKGTVTSTATCVQLHKRAERVAAVLMEKGRLRVGDHVALVYPPGVDLIAAFYGCLYCGCVPVTVRPPHPQNLGTTLPTVRMIVEVSKSACVLTTQAITRLLRSKEAAAAVDIRTWPTILDTDDVPKKRVASIFRPASPDVLAYLDFSVSTTGILAGVKMSHAATSALCRSIKLQCELYPSRQVAICLDPYCGLGLALWCLCSVYSGHQSVLVPPLELESNVALWLSAVSQYKARVTFCSYSVMEMCTKGLGTQTATLRMKGVNLSCVRTCMVVAEERPRIALTQSFSKLFKDLGLPARAVSTTFGCRVNVAICLQGTAGPDPTTVYVDMRALRHDRVRLVERGSPHSLPLMESGKILPGVKVIIAHTETKGPLGDSHLGEIWVSSPHNATGYYTVYGEEALHADHFSARLSFGDSQTIWARTGYLGFLRRTELTDASGEPHDALYVVGSLDETLELRGMRYHPIDIETSVIRAHRSIAECAVFTWTNLLVVVVELDGLEQEALDLVALVTNVVLEEHYLVVGVVVLVDPGVIPINSRGEKQRMHLRDGFLADQLDPIYVAYNM